MKTKLISIAAAASVALTGVAATPAMAQDRYQRGDYYGRGYEQDYRYADRGYDRGYYNRDNRRAYRDNRRNYRGDNCRSDGTTGTILGAIAGGLLGREIGRGGRYNRPSTTGAIIGAGAGALAGRAIDRNC